MMRLSDFTVLSFDCYGTLIDWESGLLAALRPLAARRDPAPSREEQLGAFSKLEGIQQRATPGKPYREILGVVYKRLAELWGISAAFDECLAFGDSVAAWPAFPDSAPALAYLKEHFKLVILSNVDNASFEATAARLGTTFDAVYTAEDTGAYKPDRRGFDYMLARLDERGIAKTGILHVAQSLFHDHVAAAELGLARCWIDRGQGRPGATPVPGSVPTPDFKFASLGALADAHRAERAAAGSTAERR